MIKQFIIFLSLITLCLGNDRQQYVKEGQVCANKGNAASESIKDNGIHQAEIPKSQNPHEVHLNNHETLLSKTKESAKKDETFLILEQGKKNIGDLEPVEFRNPLNIKGNPVKKTVVNTVQKTCFEGGEPYTVTFKKYLTMDLKLIPEIKKQNYKVEALYANVKAIWLPDFIIKQARSVQILNERWIGDEDVLGLEELNNPNFDVDEDFQEGGPETRNMQAVSEPDKNGVVVRENEQVHRPCWEKQFTYNILPKPCYDCELLKSDQCRQIHAECVEQLRLKNGTTICLKWKKTFACDEVNEVEDTVNLGSTNLIPNLVSEPNRNMYKALSQLEAQKQIEQNQLQDGQNISIFKGDDKRCTTNFGGGFKNCCNKNGGIGTSLHLASQCSADEKLLKKMRNENRCVFLGTRVKKKSLGVVVSSESVYCCFGTPLARSIQEGARKQLGIGFGHAHQSQCRGLTPQELERINFTKIDLSDSFSDITKSAQKMAKDIENDLKQKQEMLQKPKSCQTLKDNNNKFQVNETLAQVNNRARNQEITIRQNRDERKRRGE